MIRYEWKKLLIYRRGIYLITAFLLAELLGALLPTKPCNPELEANRASYDAYLAHVEGAYTSESRTYLENEMQRLYDATNALADLKYAHAAGTIAETDFREEFQRLLPDCEAYPGFTQLYAQYIYVREAPTQRYFLYTGGWERLLTDSKPDYLLLLLLVLLLPSFFCEEYACGMDQMLLTQKRSARSHVFVKVGVAAILALGLGAAVQLIKYLYCAAAFGLPHGNYPIQSVMRFGTSIKTLSLRQGFYLQFALRELGYLYAAMLILALSVLLRKLALTLMAGMLILPLPLLSLSNHRALLRVPGPWALTLGSIYLYGGEMYPNPISGEPVVRFAELTMPELGAYTVGITVILLALLLFCFRRNRNALLTHRRGRCTALLPLLLFGTVLSGCAGKAEPVFYNSPDVCVAGNASYTVFAEPGMQPIMLQNENGEMMPFPLDALDGETVEPIYGLYCRGDALYYARRRILGQNSDGNFGRDGTQQLVRLDLNTLQASPVFQEDPHSSWFFGLLQKPFAPRLNLGQGFFLHGAYVYYCENSTLFRINRYTGQDEPYLEDLSLCFSYDGENLYYTDGYDRLVIRNLDSGEERVIEEAAASCFRITPDGIFFLNIRDHNTLYYWEAEGSTVRKLSDISAYRFTWDADYLWLTSSDGKTLTRLDHNGGSATEFVPPAGIYSLPTIPQTGDRFILSDGRTGDIYLVDKHTLTCEKQDIPTD